MLPTGARLTDTRGFKAVYSRGRSSATDLIVVYILARPGGNRVRFGFSVGKKVGGAVKRNRAKRLLRETARTLLPDMVLNCDVVVVGRKPLPESSYGDVLAHLRKLLTRGGALASQ